MTYLDCKKILKQIIQNNEHALFYEGIINKQNIVFTYNSYKDLLSRADRIGYCITGTDEDGYKLALIDLNSNTIAYV